MKKEKLIKSFYYLPVSLILGLAIMTLTSCSDDEYIVDEWSGKTSSQYKAIGHDFAIKVINQDESTIEVKMIWNDLKPDEVTCKSVILDRRVLAQYEICPWCPNNCDGE